MADYIENLGDCTPDNLIISGDINIITATGTIASGNGKLERGTVLSLSGGTSGTGKLSIFGTDPGSNETLTPYGILADPVDATSEDAVGLIYLTGHFNKNALKVKESKSLAASDIEALRKGGIFVENAMK